jgi:hypothetical protein
MMLFCLGTLERVLKYMEKGVGARKTSKNVEGKPEA